MIVYRSIKITTPLGITFDINFPGRICAIEGESGSGKSLFTNTLTDILEQKSINGQLDFYPQIHRNSIKIFNYKNPIQDIEQLSQLKDTLIIIDNGDYLLENKPDIVLYINNDLTNQYLIFYRGLIDIRVPMKQRGVFKTCDRVVTSVYYK